MADLPILAFIKDTHTEDLGAICVITVPVQDSKLGRCYRIYPDVTTPTGYRCKWQIVGQGESGWVAVSEEEDLGTATWNGRAWEAEQEPLEVDKHRADIEAFSGGDS